MPLTPELPLGALAGVLCDLNDRMTDVEVDRFQPAGLVLTSSSTFSTSSSSWETPWPSVTVQVGASGLLVVYATIWASFVMPVGSSTIDTHFQFGVAVDGGTPVLLDLFDDQYVEGASPVTWWWQLTGSTPFVGLSQGSHSVQLAVAADGAYTYTFQQASFGCQPV